MRLQRKYIFTVIFAITVTGDQTLPSPLFELLGDGRGAPVPWPGFQRRPGPPHPFAASVRGPASARGGGSALAGMAALLVPATSSQDPRRVRAGAAVLPGLGGLQVQGPGRDGKARRSGGSAGEALGKVGQI